MIEVVPPIWTIDALHAGVLLLGDLVDVARTARDVELELDAGKGFFESRFQIPSATLRWSAIETTTLASFLRRVENLFPFRASQIAQRRARIEKARSALPSAIAVPRFFGSCKDSPNQKVCAPAQPRALAIG